MKYLLFLVSALTLTSCASSYNTINPPGLNYNFQEASEGLVYSYRLDVLTETANKKYAKKAQRKGVKIIAIKITNETGGPIVFKRDIDIYMGDQVILPIEAGQIKQTIKQPAALYLLWSPLILQIGECTPFDCDRTTLPLGAAIGVTNVIVASGANKKLDEEMWAYNILNKEIPNGETAYGLIGISTSFTSPIELRLK